MNLRSTNWFVLFFILFPTFVGAMTIHQVTLGAIDRSLIYSSSFNADNGLLIVNHFNSSQVFNLTTGKLIHHALDCCDSGPKDGGRSWTVTIGRFCGPHSILIGKNKKQCSVLEFRKDRLCEIFHSAKGKKETARIMSVKYGSIIDDKACDVWVLKDGKFAGITDSKKLRVWSFEEGHYRGCKKIKGPFETFWPGQGKKLLAVYSQASTIDLINLLTFKKIRSYKASSPSSLQIAESERALFTTDKFFNKTSVWHTNHAEPIAIINGSSTWRTNFISSSERDFFIMEGDEAGKILEIDQKGSITWQASIPGKSVDSGTKFFSSRNKRIIHRTRRNQFVLIDLVNDEKIYNFAEYLSVEFSPDEHYIIGVRPASLGGKKVVVLTNATTPRPMLKARAEKFQVSKSSLLLTLSKSGYAKVFDLKMGKKIFNNSVSVHYANFSDDGSKLFMQEPQGLLKVVTFERERPDSE